MGPNEPDVSQQLTAAATASAEAAGLDARWAAWRAKGVAEDRVFRRKMAIAAPILIVVAVVVLSMIVGR